MNRQVASGLLRIVQEADVRDGPEGHELLLGFRFGDPCQRSPAPPIASISLQPLGQSALFEGWWYRGAVDGRRHGDVYLTDCAHYTAALVQKTETDPAALRELTRAAYLELYDSLGAARHNRVVRLWNYFSGINRGSADQERYRQFSIGRAEAFEAIGIADEISPPGTAIGTISGNTLSIIALASNDPYRQFENPRQLSAYRYPRVHGPRSPKFSRGGIVSTSCQRQLFLMSGTASIVGHESAHPFDAAAQTSETLRNIEALLAGIDQANTEWATGAIRVYLRDPEDLERIAEIVERCPAFTGSQPAYLQGDICRAELLVEIDGSFCRQTPGSV